MKKKKQGNSPSPEAEMQAIQHKLGFLTMELQPREWLDTGSRLLNSVLGSEEKGLAYGKMIELFGLESNGKTLLALLLASLAQADGAKIAWVDFENSLDKSWAQSQGLDTTQIYHFYPKLVQNRKEDAEQRGSSKKAQKKRRNAGKVRLQTAEEVCEEVELWLELMRAKGHTKLFMGMDSVTAMLVEEESEAGLTDQNMRTRTALPAFMSQLLRRWIALSQTHSCMMVFINQIRMNPAARFGNPEVTPGGKALKFYCAVRASVRRVKGGKLLQKGRMIGLKGVITNFKNKSGEGSLEGASCGFKAMFLKNDWRFLSAKKLRAEEKEGEE